MAGGSQGFKDGSDPADRSEEIGHAGAGKSLQPAAGLDFLVFADDFRLLDPAKLERLKNDCQKFSDAKLQLLPGFSIRNNVGNSMFFFSPNPAWIPDRCLSGPDKKTLYVQEEDGKGGYTGYITPFLDWVLGAYHVEKGQVGYYDFSGSPKVHDGQPRQRHTPTGRAQQETCCTSA